MTFLGIYVVKKKKKLGGESVNQSATAALV